ncbi:hypothetical protein CC78DRAFT_541243 [Lojkania enalia]|uniref:Uncharacterized protein n=1 Tax=Lojkania enalia TaxID=147567 RepID=A0A9P4KG43_9PLEO|nr:hypothetical protein CC78DRAFT_541243 [Didymosphaeria enalia]
MQESAEELNFGQSNQSKPAAPFLQLPAPRTRNNAKSCLDTLQPRVLELVTHVHGQDRHIEKLIIAHITTPAALDPVLDPHTKHMIPFEEYKPLFQSYLDIQKHIHLDELDEREVRGRWKSFVGRWNRGDLARSWYDASMLKTAKETVASHRRESPARKPDARWEAGEPSRKAEEDGPDSDRDEFGPSLPEDISPRRTGPTIPRFDDLALRNELQEEDRARDRAQYVDEIRHERNLDRKAQKERLEELVPRADPGARERQLEKKRETTNTLKDFRDAKEGGDVEIGEADLMGDDGIDAYKKRKVEMERKKNEREIRREEIMRARAAERDERLADRRTKEANTMEYLKALAKERFG